MERKLIPLLLLFVWGLLGSCQDASESAAPGVNGKAGSLARFNLVGDHLYTLRPDELRTYSLRQDETKPQLKHVNDDFGIRDMETLFARDTNTLFIGANTGMHIVDISNQDRPEYLSSFQHAFTCDPVVADSQYAYVTLNSSRVNCGRIENQLNVIDVSNLHRPKEVATYPLTDPKGLGLWGDYLLVADAGVRVYDRSQPTNLQQIHHLEDINALDIIPLKSSVLVLTPEGYYQYVWENGGLKEISFIEAKK